MLDQKRATRATPRTDADNQRQTSESASQHWARSMIAPLLAACTAASPGGVDGPPLHSNSLVPFCWPNAGPWDSVGQHLCVWDPGAHTVRLPALLALRALSDSL